MIKERIKDRVNITSKKEYRYQSERRGTLFVHSFVLSFNIFALVVGFNTRPWFKFATKKESYHTSASKSSHSHGPRLHPCHALQICNKNPRIQKF